MLSVRTKLSQGCDVMIATPHRSSASTAAGAAATHAKAPPTGLDGTREAIRHPVTRAGNSSAVSRPH